MLESNLNKTNFGQEFFHHHRFFLVAQTCAAIDFFECTQNRHFLDFLNLFCKLARSTCYFRLRARLRKRRKRCAERREVLACRDFGLGAPEIRSESEAWTLAGLGVCGADLVREVWGNSFRLCGLVTCLESGGRVHLRLREETRGRVLQGSARLVGAGVSSAELQS